MGQDEGGDSAPFCCHGLSSLHDLETGLPLSQRSSTKLMQPLHCIKTHHLGVTATGTGREHDLPSDVQETAEKDGAGRGRGHRGEGL